MKFNNLEELIKLLGTNEDYLKDNEEFKTTFLKFNFSNLKRVSENTKIKIGDFYDIENDIYYNVLNNTGSKFIIPQNDTIDISKNTKVMTLNNSFLRLMIIKDKMLIIETYNFYNGLVETKVYDENTLEYLFNSNILTSYSCISTIDRLINRENILPDIEFTFEIFVTGLYSRIYKTMYGSQVNGVISPKDCSKGKEMEKMYSMYKQELSNYIDDYKSKNKSLIRF